MQGDVKGGRLVVVDEDAVVGLPIIEWANVLVRYAPLLALFVFVSAGAMFSYSVLAPTGYTASVTFMPATSAGGSSNLSSLAAQFGVSVSSGASGESPAFYTALLRSRGVLTRAATGRYVRDTVGGQPRFTTLADAFELPPGPEASRVKGAAGLLGRGVNARSDLTTSIVTLEVSAPTKNLAEQLASRLIDLVNDYNINRRRSQASTQREFIDTQLREAQDQLAAAEAAVESFQERNRVYTSSPSLTIELARLQRRVELRQQVYIGMAQSREQALIDEVRSAPVITVLDPPVASAAAIGQGPVRNAMLAGFLGLFAGIVVAFSWEALRRRARAEPEQMAELRRQISRWTSPMRRGTGRSHAAESSMQDTAVR